MLAELYWLVPMLNAVVQVHWCIECPNKKNTILLQPLITFVQQGVSASSIYELTLKMFYKRVRNFLEIDILALHVLRNCYWYHFLKISVCAEGAHNTALLQWYSFNFQNFTDSFHWSISIKSELANFLLLSHRPDPGKAKGRRFISSALERGLSPDSYMR